ncbi:MAG: Bifunctional (p)ppGpp synthase/hydrolase RelA [Chloroflexi bacterium]|nr:Bifunctional (p)ppGpp synthase/hydrolase RelA [Chloroflexota bacterium]
MREEKGTITLTPHFEEALIYAFQLHANQARKGNGVPYIAHLLSVTALVLEAGGNEEEAIAALLHDAVEDQGGRQTLEGIRRRFGERVAEIVDALTDAYIQPKPPWRKRKRSYLEHLREASPSARLVSLADKVHNARSIYRDLKGNGDGVWEKFNGGKEGTLWYYQSLREIFEATGEDPMTEEFSALVEKIVAFKKT